LKIWNGDLLKIERAAHNEKAMVIRGEVFLCPWGTQCNKVKRRYLQWHLKTVLPTHPSHDWIGDHDLGVVKYECMRDPMILTTFTCRSRDCLII